MTTYIIVEESNMSIKESVLEYIGKSGDEYVSGAQLAEEIGVSRNAVWKAVKALESEGFLFEASTNKGYRIHAENNRLSEVLISPELQKPSKIIVLEEVDSTNNYAKELASSGAEDGTVVAAEKQTSGKGRRGRGFTSPSGTGLYMSMIIRPQFGMESAQLITSCAAVAAAEAVEKLCGSKVSIKWVNDLYMNGRKICGILTEASLSMETKSLDYAVIGIGINVRSVGEYFSDELIKTATSIEDETGKKINRNKLCAELINRLRSRLENIETREFLAEYRSRELLTGNEITANSGGTVISGKAVGIDDSAGLIVRLDDGTERVFSSGEANLCRIKK